MRAVRFDQRLSVQSNQPKPVLQDDECLVRVHLAGICSTDLQLIKGYMGFNGTLGHEFVGTVEDGPDQWKGKRVVGEINCVCRTCRMCQSGLSNHCPNRTVIGIVGRDGCFAEYLAIPVVNLHEVPSNLHDEQAVFTEPVAAALQILSQVHIDQRMQVAVVGPGRLGFLVAQVLKEHGCHLRVIGRNPEKLERCEKKGIQSFLVKDVKESDQCDVVVDCTGTPAGLDLSMSMTRPRGTLVLKSTYANDSTADGDANSPVNLAPIVVNEINLVGSRCGPFAEALHALSREAVEVRSMITQTYSLDQALEAFEAAANPKHMKVLLKV